TSARPRCSTARSRSKPRCAAASPRPRCSPCCRRWSRPCTSSRAGSMPRSQSNRSWLAVRRPIMSTTPTTNANADGTQVPRILVVDDMPDNLFLMDGLLEDHYRVVLAPSGAEALKVVMSANPPDMVLLDIMMPDMDGYEVLRRIRQHPPTANIPVVFLTA